MFQMLRRRGKQTRTRDREATRYPTRVVTGAGVAPGPQHLPLAKPYFPPFR